MAVIRGMEVDRAARAASPLHLGDLAREGDRLAAEARARAEALLEEGRREREALVRGASEQGYAEGHAEGLRTGVEEGREAGRREALEDFRARVSTMEAAWGAALERFQRERSAMLLAAREDILRFAGLVAEKVTKRAVRLDERVAVDQLAAVLALLARPTRLMVAAHPDDEPMLREALPELIAKFTAAEHVELMFDPSMERGSCVARTGEGGVMDASISTQLERLLEQVMPAPLPRSERTQDETETGGEP